MILRNQKLFGITVSCLLLLAGCKDTTRDAGTVVRSASDATSEVTARDSYSGIAVRSCGTEEELTSQGTFRVYRLNDGAPIVSKNMFAAVGIEEDGENINGPSLVRLPDWLKREDRADPSAVYYLYFGHHGGEYIRIAWAADIEGPWHLYRMGSDVPIGDRGVLDLGVNGISLDNNLALYPDHIASPDVLVDDENERFIMYFHAGTIQFKGEPVTPQRTLVAVSNDGLEFANGVQPVLLSGAYLRVFSHNGTLYGVARSAEIYVAPSLEDPWTPFHPDTWLYKENLWRKVNTTMQADIDNHGMGPASFLRVRHTAVYVTREAGQDLLWLFYTRRGTDQGEDLSGDHLPERILLSRISLPNGPAENWRPLWPPEDILQAANGWECGALQATPSKEGPAGSDANQLRDPYVFEDSDGLLYLLYSGCGERGIGLALLERQKIDDPS